MRVRTISRDELRQAFLIRAELEALVTGLATPHMGNARLARLSDAQDRFAELTDQLLDRRRDEAERTRLTGEWVRANYRFHDVIYEAANLPLVERIAKSARRTFLSRWSPGGPEIDDLYRQNVSQRARARAPLRPAARADPRPPRATGSRAAGRRRVARYD